ncbi:Flp pilus assembly protein CpaB [Acidimangrovimonas pyrenivorans]|uniref:Flp pilus assembly protein CpaB n=1 Tax=Acidimangrovimonas pyrenivorans TaxID=2030798 RepID=A0ABV7ABM8_9RHOB
MRMVFGLVLVVGLGLAGFAVYMAQGYIKQTQAELARERATKKPPEPTVTVYVAKKALAYGDTLTKDDVMPIAWPKRALPKQAFTELKGKDSHALFVEGTDAPRIALRPIAQYEPLLTSNITKPGADAGITSRLSPGMRAFAIKVDVASGVSGFLRPGDHVDVYWTGKGGPGGGDLTRLIEAGVNIIAVDQNANADPTAATMIARTVTVEATQEQVAVLAQAQATGRLALSLVGLRDTSTAGKIEVDSKSLLGIQDQPVVEQKPEKKKVCTVRQRRGDKVIEVPIPCTN